MSDKLSDAELIAFEGILAQTPIKYQKDVKAYMTTLSEDDFVKMVRVNLQRNQGNDTETSPQQTEVGEWKYETGKWYSQMKMWDEIQNESNPTRKLHLLDVYERKYGKASSMEKGQMGIPGF